jgi:hypothetical protein
MIARKTGFELVKLLTSSSFLFSKTELSFFFFFLFKTALTYTFDCGLPTLDGIISGAPGQLWILKKKEKKSKITLHTD